MNRAVTLALPLVLALVGCANPEADFREAQSADTIAAYNEFIQAHPDHELTARARMRIEELEEEAAWDEARRTDSPDAYEDFLGLHPDSPRAEEAHQRAQALRASAEWQELRGTEDLSALQAFIARYPESEEAMRARQRLAELEEPPEAEPEPEVEEPRPEGDFQVQLAALQSEEAAERERERLTTALADVLGEVELRVEPPPPGSRLYRVRTAGLERAQADTLCGEIRGGGLDCYVATRE